MTFQKIKRAIDEAAEVVVDAFGEQIDDDLPETTGRWMAVMQGKGTAKQKVGAYLEVFWSDTCGWVSIPGASRFVTIG